MVVGKSFKRDPRHERVEDVHPPPLQQGRDRVELAVGQVEALAVEQGAGTTSAVGERPHLERARRASLPRAVVAEQVQDDREQEQEADLVRVGLRRFLLRRRRRPLPQAFA